MALSAATAYGTDGYFSNGYSPQCKALAGACTAVALDSLAAASNPAAMARVGRRFDLGATLFNPNREFTVTGNPSGYPGTFGLAPGRVESESKMFVMPAFGANWELGRNTTFGIAMYGNGGMNTNYKAPVFGQNPTGVNLMQMFVTPSVAQKLGKNHSVGVTMIGAWQMFKAEGLGAFSNFSADAAKLTNVGNSQSKGVGARFGYLGDLGEHLSVGASYQTKVRMSEFKKYSGLFAEGGDFDIPSAVTGGVKVKASEAVSFSADVERIGYADVKAIGSPMLPNLMQAKLGMAGGAGFGWKDITVGRFGVEVKPARTVTLRGGFSTGQQPVAASEVMFNILAPGVITKHLTAGFTKELGEGREMHFALVRALPETVTGANPLEVPGQQKIALKMNQWEVTVGFTFGKKH